VLSRSPQTFTSQKSRRSHSRRGKGAFVTEAVSRRSCQSDRFGYRESRGFIGCEICWFNGSSREKKVHEFIAGIQITRALQWRSTSREQLFSMYRHCLVSSFGLLAASLWARHILHRFRDAVAVRAPCHAPCTPTLIVRLFGTSTWEDLALVAYNPVVPALLESATP
jgi:hypothetical protein